MRKGRPRITWEQKIINFLSNKSCMTSLQKIYVGVGADSHGDQAGVRGILNRNTKSGAHLFKRHAQGSGLYALTAVARKCWLFFNKVF